MSQDIRSFFRLTKKTTVSNTDSSNGISVPKKTPRVIESSDEDVPKTPKEKKESKKRKTAHVSSNSDSEKTPSKSSTKKKSKKESPKLKTISPLEMFGTTPSRKDTLKVKSKSKAVDLSLTEEDGISDEDFIKTLKQVDEVILKECETNGSPKPQKEEESTKPEKVKTKSDLVDANIKSEKGNSKSDKRAVDTKVVKNEATPETPKSDPDLMDTSVIECTPVSKKRKVKPMPSEDETITDEERFERRRQSAALYQQYLKRGGPPKPGSKEIPKVMRHNRSKVTDPSLKVLLESSGSFGSDNFGKPDCLKGLTFIITGVLESLERDECASIITDLGGRVTKSVSGKVTYMVLGDDAGPAKTEKARSLGVKMLSEDQLLDLIRVKSGEKSLNDSKQDTNKTENTKTFKEPPKTPKTETTSKELKTPKNESKHEKSHKSSKKRKLDDEPSDSKPPKSKFLKLIEDTENQEEESPFFKKKIASPEEQPKSTTKVEPKKVHKEEPKESKVSKEAEKVESKKHRKEERKDPKESHKEETSKVAQVELIKEEIPTENLAWVDKYKPKNVKQIIGQQGDASNAKKLTVWLQNWFKNRDPSKKLVKPSPWAKSDDGAYFKCALLSGPPGVGKTTTATLVCKELGYDTVELNASDSRSKKLLQEDVGHLLTNTSLAGFGRVGEDKLSKKHVLLMDEVDGMAGNEDRGGMQELILLIKKSSIPVICMCNDRNHPKVRSLANYCFDLKFSKPRVEQIRSAMMSVCFKEGIKIKAPVLDQIISGTQNDLRQTLNHLSLWSKGSMEASSDGKSENCKKDFKLGPWDVVRKVFTEEEQKKMSIHEKSDLFFNDYSISPLFVQENYLSVTPHANKKEWLDRVAEAADYLSLGDLVEKRIRSAGAWNLLPVQAMYSSVAPGHAMSGHFSAQINFPAWLGKNSKKNKFQRLTSEIQTHTRLCTSGSQLAINLDYLPYIRDTVIRPLQAENIPEAVKAMQDYHLTREDLDGLVELSLWPRQKDPLSIINGKTKAAFTRAYNKEVNMVYAGTTSKKKAVNESEEYGDEEAEVVDESEDEDDVTRDNLIKAKKATKVKEEKVSKASSSKESGAKKPTKPRAKKSSK